MTSVVPQVVYNLSALAPAYGKTLAKFTPQFHPQSRAHLLCHFKPSRGVAVLQTERMAMVLRSYMRAKKFKVHDFVVMQTMSTFCLAWDRRWALRKPSR
jgi:hypothetical protein